MITEAATTSSLMRQHPPRLVGGDLDGWGQNRRPSRPGGFQDAIFSARGKARTCRFQSPRRAASECLYVLLLTPAPAWPSAPSRQYSLYAISETVTGSDPLQRAVSLTRIPSQIHDRFATPHESLAFARISTFTGHFVLGCVAVDIIWSGVVILSHQIPNGLAPTPISNFHWQVGFVFKFVRNSTRASRTFSAIANDHPRGRRVDQKHESPASAVGS